MRAVRAPRDRREVHARTAPQAREQHPWRHPTIAAWSDAGRHAWRVRMRVGWLSRALPVRTPGDDVRALEDEELVVLRGVTPATAALRRMRVGSLNGRWEPPGHELGRSAGGRREIGREAEGARHTWMASGRSRARAGDWREQATPDGVDADGCCETATPHPTTSMRRMAGEGGRAACQLMRVSLASSSSALRARSHARAPLARPQRTRATSERPSASRRRPRATSHRGDSGRRRRQARASLLADGADPKHHAPCELGVEVARAPAMGSGSSGSVRFGSVRVEVARAPGMGESGACVAARGSEREGWR